MGAPELPEPFLAHGEHFAIDLPGAGALFTTRRGGVSSGPYESLNLGRLTDDEPDAVERNRTGLEDAVGRPLSFVRQVHGVELRTVTGADVPGSRGSETKELRYADGQVTTEPGHALAALTADCLPVAVAGHGGVAMIHAGWRGLAGPCCYETGAEVHNAFSGYSAEIHRGSNLDLPGIAREGLGRAGVEQVHDIGLCTICSDPRLFFSHRRDHGVTGRQAGLAWLS
ncbi:MAG: polyphenol oxidase family protein [Solirubrobacteraceae bacterium]